jgi:hypothetical protein
MILFNLKCAKDHQFEGWFRDGDAFDAQAAAKKINCPICGSRRITKALMAPRIGKHGAKEAKQAEIQAAVLRELKELRKKVESNCDYVGDKFAEEARRIHYGEVDPRGIYGEASDEEASALTEEGVEFAQIPWVPRQDS